MVDMKKNISNDMKKKQFFEPWSTKLVLQLLKGVTFAYDLCLGHSRHYWKCLIEDYYSEDDLHHENGYKAPKTLS